MFSRYKFIPALDDGRGGPLLTPKRTAQRDRLLCIRPVYDHRLDLGGDKEELHGVRVEVDPMIILRDFSHGSRRDP